ncbi:hypothetical protein NECAME_01800 [Necator americanus]|uniref:Uncharacterized protein n=1 Tax=Necator americanus TaxID=51031 RepID=W2TNY6_NECAM|nr:hypothetical protein NECAME_01800 [Necator americanus]ETN83493.1 hypothetical protein NECAME_01800 [Necator americanus]
MIMSKRMLSRVFAHENTGNREDLKPYNIPHVILLLKFGALWNNVNVYIFADVLEYTKVEQLMWRMESGTLQEIPFKNSDRLDVDVKSCSQSSLPDAFEVKSNSLRGTKSLSDLAMEITQERTCLSSRNVAMAVDEPTAAAAGPDNLTNRITEWLTAIDIQEHKQNV